MDDPSGRRAALAASAFLGTYVAVVAVITVANNGWYPLLATEFCGSLGDFTDGAVPDVCIGFGEYWTRAAIHPPYALVAAVVAGLAAAGVAFQEAVRRRLA